jgi:predicted transposase YdaD
MLGLTDADLKKSRFYQEVFAEGEQEGQQEGRHAEALELITRLLRRRCGALPPRQAQARGARLSLAQLEALGEALLDFTTPADLQRWLREHTSAKKP